MKVTSIPNSGSNYWLKPFEALYLTKGSFLSYIPSLGLADKIHANTVVF